MALSATVSNVPSSNMEMAGNFTPGFSLSPLLHEDVHITCKKAHVVNNSNIYTVSDAECRTYLDSAFVPFECNLNCKIHTESPSTRGSMSYWTGRPGPLEKWGFGLLFSFLVSICAVLGAFLLPMMQKPYFDRVLNGLIGLAVGCLSGSAIFHLIPESFFDVEPSAEEELILLNKGFVIMSGIYLFFLSERGMKIYADCRKRMKAAARERKAASISAQNEKLQHDYSEHDENNNSNNPREGSYYSQAPIIVHVHDDDDDVHSSAQNKAVGNGPSSNNTGLDAASHHHHAIAENGDKLVAFLPATNATDHALGVNAIHLHPLGHQQRSTRTSIRRYADEQPCKTHEHDHGIERDDVKKRPIRTVAWMVIAGDGLHNFIDGLGMGAAFSMSILNGISVSIAVLCEELPHELGDLAILINSGMSLKQALFYNFMSAIICILGLCCGMILGDVGGRYVFALAAGAFLYISLVDMFPEMTHTTEAESKKSLKAGLIMLLIQNVGFVSGVCIMYLMARYGKHLENYVKN